MSHDATNHFCTAINECINRAITEFSGPKPIIGREGLDAFTQAFVEAFLMDVNENEKESSKEDREDGVSLHLVEYDISDIDAKAMQKIVKDCKRFQSDHDDAIRNGGTNFDDPYSQAGHDFYLTRVGHGAGFWEKNDWPDPYGKELNDAAKSKKFGHIDGYVGDDNKVYIMGAEGDWTAGGAIQGVNEPKGEKPYSDGYEGEEWLGNDDDISGISEGGAHLKKGEEHAGITDDMSGRWTIKAMHTGVANKKETPLMTESQPAEISDKINDENIRKLFGEEIFAEYKELTRHGYNPILKITFDERVGLNSNERKGIVNICAWCDDMKKNPSTKKPERNITNAVEKIRHDQRHNMIRWDASHGICKKHMTECFPGIDERRESYHHRKKSFEFIKLKSLLEMKDADFAGDDPTWPDFGDVDKDFERGETNFPHGSGHPNVNKDYDKVVNINSVYGVDDADMHKYNTAYTGKVIQYVNQHLPWVKGYFKEDSYSDHTEVDGVASAVERVISNFRHWAAEKEENVTKQGAEEWWLGMYKRAHRIVQEFPDVIQDLEKYYKFLGFINDESPKNAENQKNYPLHVTLYDVTRLLGGNEEGGWWYNNNSAIKGYKVTSHMQAEKAARVLYNEIKQADLDGQPIIHLEKKPGSMEEDPPTGYS